jgi:hypothetical protein
MSTPTAEIVQRLFDKMAAFRTALPDEERMLLDEILARAQAVDRPEVQGYGGEYSFTFVPADYYVGVLLQQGQVQLDSDAGQGGFPASFPSKAFRPPL